MSESILDQLTITQYQEISKARLQQAQQPKLNPMER
jgi:hypothetical protein